MHPGELPRGAEPGLVEVHDVRGDEVPGDLLQRGRDQPGGLPRGGGERARRGRAAGQDVANWAYADLPKVFRPETTARSFVVKTVADLEKALSAPNDTLIFIEAVMDPFDAPTAVMESGNNGADLDYGPRGPQHRDNMLIRPAT